MVFFYPMCVHFIKFVYNYKCTKKKGIDNLSFDFIKDKNMKIHFIGIGGISMSGLSSCIY